MATSIRRPRCDGTTALQFHDLWDGRYSCSRNDSTRLANLGIGHGAADGGAGYTYLNPAKGQEFSAVAGLTYNLENPFTNYQNGVDFHLDWAASQFLSKQVFVGPVGYVYDQLSCDSGPGDRVGCFESRVIGIGPQIGYLFPIGNMQGYLNFKAYGEFDAAARPSGWNAWSCSRSRRQRVRQQRPVRWSTNEAISLTSIALPSGYLHLLATLRLQ